MLVFVQLGDRSVEKRPEDLRVLFCLLQVCFLCIFTIMFSFIRLVHFWFCPVGVIVDLLIKLNGPGPCLFEVRCLEKKRRTGVYFLNTLNPKYCVWLRCSGRVSRYVPIELPYQQSLTARRISHLEQFCTYSCHKNHVYFSLGCVSM